MAWLPLALHGSHFLGMCEKGTSAHGWQRLAILSLVWPQSTGTTLLASSHLIYLWPVRLAGTIPLSFLIVFYLVCKNPGLHYRISPTCDYSLLSASPHFLRSLASHPRYSFPCSMACMCLNPDSSCKREYGLLCLSSPQINFSFPSPLPLHLILSLPTPMSYIHMWFFNLDP